MTLEEHYRHSGALLFRSRSYLPLPLLAVVLVSLRGFHYPFGRDTLDTAWEVGCLGVSLLGLAIRVLVIGYAAPKTSGRATDRPSAAVLNSTGMYSIVRHPLYLGNYLMWFGTSLLPCLAWVPLVVTLVYWLEHERIMLVEEDYLRQTFGESFLAWAATTPAFIPAFRLWRAPARPFCVRRVLRAEYRSLLGIMAVMATADTVADSVATGRLQFDVLWGTALGSALVVAAVLRYLDTHTGLLASP